MDVRPYIIFLILGLMAVSCAPLPPPEQQTIVLVEHPNRAPEVCEAVTTAINRGDWATLRLLVRPGMKANEYVTVWQDAAAAGRAMQVGELTKVETVAEAPGRQYELYTFALRVQDGAVHNVWLQIKAREKRGQMEVEDFWRLD